MIYRFAKTRRQRVIDFLWGLLEELWKPAIKLLGAILIYIALKHHFNIHFTYFESVCLGIGIGFLVD